MDSKSDWRGSIPRACATMSDLVQMLRAAYEDPFATEHDPRHLLLLAANAIEQQKEVIRNLLLELAKK